MRRRWMQAGMLLALVLAMAPGLTAQIPQRGAGDRERLEERVRARMARMIQERLELSQEESDELGSLMEGFFERRRALRREEIQLRRELARWGDEAGGPGEAEAILERMVELREAEVDLFREEQEELLGLLGPEKLVTFHALREQMSQRLRELRGGLGRGGGPPRGPGGPPGGLLF